MAILESIEQPGQRLRLLSNELLGRTSDCSLRLVDQQISGRHACIEWRGNVWIVRDLSSRNGTFVNEQRVAIGEDKILTEGTLIRLARACSWRLIDADPPSAMAMLASDQENDLSARDERATWAQDGILALPADAVCPEVSVYQSSLGEWLAEFDDRVTEVTDRQHLTVGDHLYRIYLPSHGSSTLVAEPDQPTLADVGIHFSVSRDEEHVGITVFCRGQQWALEPRAHHYTLLTLARVRVRDQAEGSLPDSACGWIHQEELLNMLAYTANRLHTDIYRIRRKLSELGIPYASEIVERRPTAKQLRLSVERIQIMTV